MEASAPEVHASPGAGADRGRLLVFIPNDVFARVMLDSGAMRELLGGSTFLVASSGRVQDARSVELLARQPNFLGTVTDPRREVERSARTRRGRHRLLTFDYPFLEGILAAELRGRTDEMLARGVKTRKRRLFFLVAAKPGLRTVLRRLALWRTGLHPEIRRLIDEVRPDLVIAVTGGYDSLGRDAIRCAGAAGVRSLGVVPNWDALSGKAGFLFKPDHLGVWGRQSAEHATGIHGFEPERVHLLGAPGFEPHFRYRPGTHPSPFPFRYALFAGSYLPFDELALAKRLEAAIERSGASIKIVYRAHPVRAKRKHSDFVDERLFKHVVIDPQIRDIYLRHFDSYEAGGHRRKWLPPPLDYYPPLLENAEFLICPLSTMMIEALLFDRPVLVPAYHDGIHKWSPGRAKEREHYRGFESVLGIDFCNSEDELIARFERLINGTQSPPIERGLREGIRYFLHFDQRSYGERLGTLIDVIGRDG